MKKPLLIFLLLSALISVLNACSSPLAEKTPGQAPEFSLTATDGRTISLSDYKGKPVFLNFWQTT